MKRYEDYFTFCGLSLLIGVWFLMPVFDFPMRTVINVFIREGLPWIGVGALFVFVAEGTISRFSALWRFYKIYWLTFVGGLYGFILCFGSEWNWGMVILPLVMCLRLFMPYHFIKWFNSLVFEY